VRKGLAQNRDSFPILWVSRLCKADNFPVGRHADFLFRAIGAAPMGTTMPPTISRPDALSPRHMRASARRRPELVAAI
jgi:hypothetical protein